MKKIKAILALTCLVLTPSMLAMSDQDQLELHRKLHQAVCSGNVETTRSLLETGADPNHLHKLNVPLFYAIQGKHEAIVRLLIDTGAEPTILGWGGKISALPYAVETGHVGIVQILLDALGSEAPKYLSGSRADKMMLLHHAADRDHKEMVCLLLTAGADPNTAAFPPCDILRWTREWKRPLHYAAERGHTDIIQTLLAAGAKPDSLTYVKGVRQTPLDLAAQSGHENAVVALAEGGAPPDTFVPVRHKMWDYTTMLDVLERNRHLAHTLIRIGTDPEERDYKHRTLLQWYAQHPRWYDETEGGYRPTDGMRPLLELGASMHDEKPFCRP